MRWSSASVPIGETYRALVHDSELIAVTAVHTVSISVAVFYFIEGAGTPNGNVLTIVLAAWASMRLVSRRYDGWWPLADLLVVSGYLASTPALVTPTHFATGASPMLAVAGTTVISFGLAFPPSRSGPAALMVVVAWSVGILRLPGDVAPWTVFGLDFLVVEWALVALCRHLVGRAAAATDALFAGVADEEVARSVAVARYRQARRQCALMHDTAASTLLMVGNGAVSSREVLSRQVDRDLSAIRAFASGAAVTPDVEQVDLGERLRSVCSSTATEMLCEHTGSVVVDADVADAVVGAAVEALTNARRHANASSVQVVLAPRSVSIIDDGCGFDMSSDRVRSRFGVRNSIVSRVEDVGGRVTIDSTPDVGTRIVLAWGEQKPHAERVDPADGVAQSQRLLRGFGFGLATISAVVIVSQSTQAVFGDHGDRAVQIGIVVVALVCTAVAAVSMVRRVPSWTVWLAYGLLVAVVPVQEWILPSSDLTAGSNWALWALGWPVAALVYRKPFGIALLALGGFWLVGSVVLLARSPTRETVATLGYNLASVALIQALSIVFTMFLARAVRTALALNDAYVDRVALEAGERAIAEDVNSRYAALSRTLVPLLKRLRDPDTDPRDPSVRVAALIEDARLRRLFAQTDNQNHDLLVDLAAAIERAEERGVSVAVDVGTALPEVPVEVRDQLVAAIAPALDGAMTRARVVFTATTDTITASVVCDCPAETCELIETTLGIAPATADDLAWIELQLPVTR